MKRLLQNLPSTFLFASGAIVLAFSGCERKTEGEKAIEKTGDAIEDAADEVGDAVDDATD